MSDLQISLLGIGAIVIAGVFVFNRFQERKFRRIADAHFKSKHDDVLLDSTANPEKSSLHIDEIVPKEEWRIEPKFEPEEPTFKQPHTEPKWSQEPIVEVKHEEEPIIQVTEEPKFKPQHQQHNEPAKAQQVDDSIAYVATLQAGETIITEDIALLLQQFAALGKPVHWSGQHMQTGAWEEISPAHPGEYEKIRVSLQLADRKGHLSEVQLDMFCDGIQNIAADLQALMDCPEKQPALQRAIELDDFCAEVDVLIGLNVLSHNGETLPATKIRAQAEAAGMKLQADGTFHLLNDDGVSLYSLSNHDEIPFSADNIKHMVTHGVTFLFDVPRAPGGIHTFNSMVTLAKQVAHTLNGDLVDDNRNKLDEKSIATIRQQLSNIYTKMDARHISAGSQRALNLFS
ncbi:cell division protein ZipA C-terminal FtsZ-binding domain-containing protein [Sulfurirhabdus autotrophica]|uniref:Cell division protein ZipA n=1 Tax=Sulfurirhabdus autotrophica TaxID=1706046 RepID=A0A4R3YDQ3_9PROT|nr:cell division protein ZipA C-terminal FtsZ-binding domain-containing protein [Sulfurirhabdus autotrophica]TCV90150.1 FtsZ-interacting cell division protein ZipA [Sulfurirhabdus autotrophica]